MGVVAWVHKIATKCGDEQITGGKCFANNGCKWCSVNADGYIAFVHNDVALLPFVSVSTQYKSHSFCLTLYIIRKQVTDNTTKGRGMTVVIPSLTGVTQTVTFSGNTANLGVQRTLSTTSLPPY